MNKIYSLCSIILLMACTQTTVLEKDMFISPDKTHYPQTWFHFIGNNVSLEGITADLEAIAQAGISGVQFFHGYQGDEKWPEVEEGIAPLSENWDDAVKHIAQECKRLGLEFTIQNCPGWAMAGGPWVKPENAMRILVNSRTDVSGKDVDIVLPQPQPSDEEWRDYREVAVLAFPTPEGDTGEPLKVRNISGPKGYSWETVFADKDGYVEDLPFSDKPYVITMDFVEPSTVRSIELPSINSYSHDMCYEPSIDIRAYVYTADGKEHKIADFAMPQANWQDDDPLTIACPEVKDAVSFRFEFNNYRKNVDLEQIRLYSAARKNSWESEAGLTLRAFERSADDIMQSKAAYVAKNDVIDITEFMTADGHLQWTAPDDRAWTILRIGHVNMGKKNAPAPPEGTGWECDKLSVNGAEAHFPGYVGRLADGALKGGLLDGMLLDSWECNTQMWTQEMEKEFAQRCGYELREWLPALFGYVMDEPQTTARFLLDWRGTTGNLVTEKFYRRMAELGHEKGLKVVYETAAGDIVPADILEYFKYADIPMCEFWQPFNEKGYVGSLNFKPVKPTASAARIYGKPRVAAESFTSFRLTWNETFELFKEYADYHFIEGVTHNVFHTYTHNPQVDYLKPGTSFGGGIGSPFLRGQTWWPYMNEFTTYLARCSYMLEQGRPVSSVLWYLGDEISHKPDQEYDFPEGYRYDYCNPDVLLNRLSVKDGKLQTPEGISYEMLWVPENKRMLPETIARIHELILDGAKVAAMPPKSIATLIGGEDNVKRFETEVEGLWGNVKKGEMAAIGKGSLLCDVDIDRALKAFGIEPDMKGDVRWLHRQDESKDWYFVTPMKMDSFCGSVDFPVSGAVELWNPVTGETTALAAEFKDGRTFVELDMPVAGSCFIVVDRTQKHVNPEVCEYAAASVLDNTWSLSFPEGWDAPSQIEINQLVPWHDLPMSDEAKAFSGKVSYSTSFVVDPSAVGKSVRLDLGTVSSIAEVRINGKAVDTLWCSPYVVEIGEFVQGGENRLEVDVTSTWHNRLVYDASQEVEARKTWVIAGPDAGNALKPYGLLGPVRLCHQK